MTFACGQENGSRRDLGPVSSPRAFSSPRWELRGDAHPEGVPEAWEGCLWDLWAAGWGAGAWCRHKVVPWARAGCGLRSPSILMDADGLDPCEMGVASLPSGGCPGALSSAIASWRQCPPGPLCAAPPGWVLSPALGWLADHRPGCREDGQRSGALGPGRSFPRPPSTSQGPGAISHCPRLLWPSLRARCTVCPWTLEEGL